MCFQRRGERGERGEESIIPCAFSVGGKWAKKACFHVLSEFGARGVGGLGKYKLPCAFNERGKWGKWKLPCAFNESFNERGKGGKWKLPRAFNVRGKGGNGENDRNEGI
jgi:hypothetical protein